MRLGVERDNVFPAYEDAWYFLWRERKLPSNVDPFDSRLDDPHGAGAPAPRVRARASMRRSATCCRSASTSAGRARWLSSPWYLRDERCYLIPGDSPIGYRLPLDSLPWAAPGDVPWLHAPDPTQPLPPLPPRAPIRHDDASWHATAEPRDGAVGEHPTPGGMHDVEASTTGAVAPEIATPQTPSASAAAPASAVPAATARRELQPFESAGFVVRTAISAEPREGRLYVFMPPMATLEDYLDLVAAVEDTAAAMQMPVILEGYEPPRDPRLQVLRVTPDPGVIEVNIHPASSWDELVDRPPISTRRRARPAC